MFKRKELAQAARKNLKKHYCTWMDRWYWNESRDSSKIWEREYFIKDKGQWEMVRQTYLDKKNLYLKRNEYDKSSFICFIEAVNEVYYRIR